MDIPRRGFLILSFHLVTAIASDYDISLDVYHSFPFSLSMGFSQAFSWLFPRLAIQVSASWKRPTERDDSLMKPDVKIDNSFH